MYLCGLTVCVDYSHLLRKSLETWAKNLDFLIVVTSPEDRDTQNLCLDYFEEKRNGCSYITDAFYRNGAIFNKAAAICECLEKGIYREESGQCFSPLFRLFSSKFFLDWSIFFDADIIPQENWRNVFDDARPIPGKLYGAKRYLENGQCYNESELAGYFQIFHSTDQNVQIKPLLETNWRHAGGYDSEFHNRWQEHNKIFLPINLIHQGEPGKNWWGKGNEEMMDAMIIERLKTNRLAENEKIK